ncbi:MAG: hypothetical protein MJ153_04600 [Clostridia bacterium]|nr:hypothetical protein [Clostridia bacterium]
MEDDIISGVRLIDVAMKYGWKSHSAFSKSFNREFGFPPSLLRTMKTQLDCLGGSYMNQIFLKATEVGAGKEKLFEVLKDMDTTCGIGVSGHEFRKNSWFSFKFYGHNLRNWHLRP